MPKQSTKAKPSAGVEHIGEKLDEVVSSIESNRESLQEINATLSDLLGEFRRISNILDTMCGCMRDRQ